jgi:RNA polymerase sigma factor (sigma-70 family)
MNSDGEMLRRYAQDKSEEDFAELVRRHINLVHSVALRSTGGDRHRAQDVAQSVFTALARKAAALHRHPSLTGWLYTSTRFIAAKAVRAERRRQNYEREAQIMNEASDNIEAHWDRIRPILDEVMDVLNPRDREAILLRFFEGQTFSDIGTSLRLSEDAARMRVERALNRIRERLARRGITSTTAALASALTGQTVAAAPAGLATVVTGAALSGAVASGGAGSFFTTMMLSKLNLTVTAAVAMIGLTIAVVEYHNNAELRDENAKLRRQNRQIESLQGNDLKAATAEIDHLRGQLTKLQTDKTGLQPQLQTLTSGQQKQDPEANQALVDTGMISLKDLKNADRATPRSACEKIVFAANTGDVDTIAGMLKITPEARTKAEAFLAGLPPETRAQYSTPEQFAAMMIASSAQHVDAMQVVAETPDGHGILVHGVVQVQGADNQENYGMINVPFYQRPDGWEAQIGAKAIDNFINKVTGKTNAK